MLKTFERFQQGAPHDYLIRYRSRPGMSHIAAQIAERAARLFPEEFAALAEHARGHEGFLDEGIRRADEELRFYLALASKLVTAGEPVITNDFHLAGPERILVVTGPNQGGKLPSRVPSGSCTTWPAPAARSLAAPPACSFPTGSSRTSSARRTSRG